MKKVNYVDEYDNWAPDSPLSKHIVLKDQENFPEELAEE